MQKSKLILKGVKTLDRSEMKKVTGGNNDRNIDCNDELCCECVADVCVWERRPNEICR